jgi:quercetin dioxygenase-like cupin family protein
MKNPVNRVAPAQQHTVGAEGYVFDGAGEGQMAFWTCTEAQTSDWHVHDFDEYMVVVAGEYVLLLEGSEQVLGPGDETTIAKGVNQAARVSAGTRTIHAFGGRRVVRE